MLETKEQIKDWLNQRDIFDYNINEDNLVNVNGDLYLSYEQNKIEDFAQQHGIRVCEIYISSDPLVNRIGDFGDGWPLIYEFHPMTELPIKFGKVEGSFFCNGNDLTSLKGSPVYVSGSFWCGQNLLNTLDGAPKFIGEDLIVDNRKKFESLGKIETEIGGFFACGIGNRPPELENSPFTEEYGQELTDCAVFNATVKACHERRVLESQLAKLVEPYDREKEGPLPSERAAKPKMKHKI